MTIKPVTITLVILLMILYGLTTILGQTIKTNDYLVSFNDTIKGGYGYKNQKVR